MGNYGPLPPAPPPIYSGGKAQPPTAPVNPQTNPSTGDAKGTVHYQGRTSPGMGPAMMTPQQVRAMQLFLSNHGFEVAQDGIMGPLTKSAAAAFRANHKGGSAWNAAHGIGTHPGTQPHGNVGDPSTPARTTAAAPGNTGLTGNPLIDGLLATLLQQGGNVGSLEDPASFGSAAAAPDLAQAKALQSQIGLNGKQEAQNQADISNWYGLGGKGSQGYDLSVLGRLGQAKANDAQMAQDASSNVGDIAKALAGSIGGSANSGSASVAAQGANDAGTMAAIGQSNTDYENAMNPLLAAEARGQMSREKAANSQTLLALQNQLATAQGQATADRAGGVDKATQANNALEQQGFANKGNLLSMLVSLQAANPNANTPANALTNAKIAQALSAAGLSSARAKAIASGKSINGTTPAGKAPAKVDLGSVFNHVASMLNIPNGSVNLPQGTSLGGVAHMIGSALQGAGIAKTDPRYQRLAQSILASFKDANGNPLNVPSGWFGPNTQ